MGDYLEEDGLTTDEKVSVLEACTYAESPDSDGGRPPEADGGEGVDGEEADGGYGELLRERGGDHLSALFEYCFKNNVPYVSEVAKPLLRSHDDSVECGMPRAYLDALKADGRFEGLTFFGQIKQQNFEKIYSEKLELLSLTEDDKKSRQQIMEIFSYDPFKNEPIEARAQLYRDLAGMANEGMRKDVAKQKAALSIVRSYGNIEKYQKKITELTGSDSIDEDTQKQLDSYLQVISKIQTTINQTAEKNNFTTKGIGSNGKGMLSDVMNQIEEKGIDDGVTNFYDIQTSGSIREIADISFKSQLNQVALSKTDYADVLSEQCKMVKEAQMMCRKAMEAKRLAMEKLTKQGLLDELEADYRKKGIDESEIEEFINREMSMYDGRE